MQRRLVVKSGLRIVRLSTSTGDLSLGMSRLGLA